MIAVPGFLSAGIDPSTIVDIVNYVTIGLLAGSLIIALLGFVRGLFRGWRYGTYRLVMFAILAAVAMLTLQPIVNAVGNFDLAQFGLGSSWELPAFTLNVNGTSVTIASEGTTAFAAVSGYIENLCKALNVNMAPADLSAYALSLAVSLISFLLIMVDALLIAIFGAFFVFLLWHLAFKRFIRKDKRKASYRKGKIVGGLTNCLVSIICLAMLVAPLTSMANSLSAAWHKGQLDQEDQTTLHTVDNSVYQAIDGAVKAYDNSAFAQAFFAWNKDQNGETLDMKLVDFLTSTSVSLGEQEQVQMSFLSEVSSLAQVFTIAVQSGVISEDGFNNIKWPLLLTTSAAPEALRSLASSRLVTGILPYGLSILENIDPVSSYIKVGTGIDFSDNNYQLTLEELADIYDEVIHSNLIDGVVDPDTGELGSSSEVAGNVLSEENASLVASIFESLDGENLKIFDALIESALTIQAFKDYESGKVATDELTIADFLPAVTLVDFAPEDGKPTLIPEAYEDIKWGEIFADFFLSTVNLVNVDEELYLAVCNAIPDWNGETKPFSYQEFLAPILKDGNFAKAEAALVGVPQTSKAAEGEETSQSEVTPLLGTEFLLNATPKLVKLLGNNLNSALKLSGEDAIDLSPIAAEMAADQSTILPEWRALLNVVGDFATTEAGQEFLLHVEAMPGIYFAPDKSFVGVDEGLAAGLKAGLADLDASKLATAIIPQAFEGFLEGENSPVANLGVELSFDFDVPNIGSQLSNLLSTLLDAQDIISYLASLNGQTLTGWKLKHAISTIADHANELSDLLVAVATSPMLNPVVSGENNANIVSLIGLVFSTIGLEEPSNLDSTLSSLSPEATGTEMENFVAALLNVMDSGLVDATIAEKVDLASFEDVSFEEAFAKFDDSLIFRDCFGPVLDNLLAKNETFAPFFEDGFSFANVVDWQKEGQNLDVLISSISELGAAGLLDGGTIDVFNSDPGAVENIVSVLATSDLFVSREDDGTYTYSFPRIVAKMIEDNLPAGSEAASFFKVPDGDGVAALAQDIRSTAVEGGSAADVEASQDLWKEEAHRLALTLRDILSLGGIDSIAADGGPSLKELSPEPLDFLLHDATDLTIFGRVLNYSLYSLLSEQIASSFPSSEGLSNLAAFYEPTLASYQETIRESGNVFESEADAMSKLVYAILDPSTGIVNAIGEDNKITLDINDVSPEYLVRPLLQSLSGSYLFNSVAEGKEETAYESILSSVLEESGLFEDGEALAYVESVRGTNEDFAAVKEAWNVESEAIVATVAAIQESGVATDSLTADPMSFFEQGKSYGLQRAKLENILVAATDSKIIRPALASIVEEAAATLGKNYAVNGDWLIDAEASLYREEAKTISYVMMYGSLLGDASNVSVDTLLASPAAESLLREGAHSYVFNTRAEGDGGYPAFVQIVYDALDGSAYYGEKGTELTGNKIEAVIARIDTSAMDDEARFAAWEREVDSLMDTLSSLDRTGLELSGDLRFDDLFPEGAETSLLDEREADLRTFLEAANESRLIYPGLANFLRDSVEAIELPNGASLENANYYYGGRGNPADEYGLLAKPYDSEEMGYLASIIRRASGLKGETNFTIETLNEKPDAETLLRSLAASKIFDSLEETPGSDLMTYTVFEGFVAEVFKASSYYDIENYDTYETVNAVLARALTKENGLQKALMSYPERVLFWNGETGIAGEIGSLMDLAAFLQKTNLDLSGNVDVTDIFKPDESLGEAEKEAFLDDQEQLFDDFLQQANADPLIYPGLPSFLKKSITSDRFPNNVSLANANYYYGGRGNLNWGYGLLSAPYDAAEMSALASIVRRSSALEGEENLSISSFSGNEDAEILLRDLARSRIFDSLEEEPGTDLAAYTVFESLVASTLEASGFYGSGGDSETRINEILARALTVQGSSVLMPYQERAAFWNGEDGASGEIANLCSLADALAAAQNDYGIDFANLSFKGIFSDASRAEGVRGALYGILNAASSSEIVYPAVPLNLESSTSEGDYSFSLEGANFYYTGKWGSGADLLAKEYSHEENERLSYVAMYAGLLSSADLTSLSDVDGSYVGGLLANMSSSYIFNAAEPNGNANAFVGALEQLLSENGTIKDFYFSSENPADAQLGYASAAEKIKGLAEGRYKPLASTDSDVGKRNWGDFVLTAGSTVVSLQEIIDSEGLETVIDGFAGGSAELPAERDELTKVLRLINGSPILKDMVPNAVRSSLAEGGGIALEGVDFDRSNPYYAYDELGAATNDEVLNIKWFDGEQIGTLVDIVYDAKDLTGLFADFTTIDETKIQGIRKLLVEMAGSKVFNSIPFESPLTGGSGAPFEVSGVVVDQGFTVFQGVLFYMMVETSLHERAYNPVLDAEKGFASAGAKLTSALFKATGTPETAFGDKARLGETAVAEFVSDGADGGLLTTIFNTLQEGNELKLDFSNSGILKFDDIEPVALGKILMSLNRVSFCDGVIANGAEYLLGDAINLGEWSSVTTDRKLEGERGSLRLSEIRYIGTGKAPDSLYYHLGGADGVVDGVDDVYSFEKTETGVGESSLIGPTDVYLDEALAKSVFAAENIADFSFVYDLSTYHLLTEKQYEIGAIPSLVRFLGNVLYDEENQKYDQIASADQFFAPLLSGSSEEGDVDYVYEIASFLLNENGVFNANFETDGTILAADINAADLAYISGDVLIRNFLKFTINVPEAAQTVSVDLGNLFLHETTSDPVQTERNLIASLHESIYEEANMAADGAAPTFEEREAAYPGGLTYLSNNLADITMAVALYEASSNISLLDGASDAFKQLWLASGSTLGLMEAVPAGSEAVPVAETSVANNFVTSLVNRSYASGLAYQNGSPNRGFLGFVVAVDGFNAKQISTVSGLASLSKPRLEIEAVGGSLPSTLAGLRADSFLPFRSFYTALYQVLAGGNAVLDRSADQSYASLVNALNNEGMKLENAGVIGLGATLLDSYFYEVLAGGRYIHSQVEITSTMVSSSTGKPLSQSEISILAGAPLDLTGEAKYFGTNSYLQQAYRLLS